MKTNREIREAAREQLKSGWFPRLLAVTVVLYAICYGIQVLLGAAFSRLGISAAQIPAMVFELFVSYIFGGIAAFGIAAAMLKAVNNDEGGWFSSSMGGFARPLEVAWLLIEMNVRIMLWALLLIFPGLIAVYRFRLAWYVKSEHPDWSSGKCLNESSRLMTDRKWQAFCFDLVYFCQLMLIGIVMGGAVVFGMRGADGSPLLAALGSLLMLLSCWMLCRWAVSFMYGRTVFYREVLKSWESSSHSSANSSASPCS